MKNYLSKRTLLKQKFKTRAPNILRLASAGLDLAFCSIIWNFIGGYNGIWYLVFFGFYYFGSELKLGRTPAKYVLGLNLQTVNGKKAPRFLLIWRTILRIGMLYAFIATTFAASLALVYLLFWRRANFFDLITGLRVRDLTAKVKTFEEVELEKESLARDVVENCVR